MLSSCRCFSLPWRLMSTLAELTLQLEDRQELSSEAVLAAASALAAPEVPDADKAAFLTSLSAKGETAREVAGFALAFRARAMAPGVGKWASERAEIGGTGGDQRGGFKFSTLVDLRLASAGGVGMSQGNG